MSRIVHRQPVWSWSLVLLSALLLSPTTASAVLAALRQTRAVPVREAIVQPRRAVTDDQEAMAAAAQPGAREDIATEPTAEPTVALLTSTPATVTVPEAVLVTVPTAHGTIPLARGVSRRQPARAPPA